MTRVQSFYDGGNQSFDSTWDTDSAFPLSSPPSPSLSKPNKSPFLGSFGFGYNHKHKQNLSLSAFNFDKLGDIFEYPLVKVLSNTPWGSRHEPWWKRTLDPSSEVVVVWNRIFLVAALLAVFIDPLLFYFPSVVVVGGSGKPSTSCMGRNLQLGATVTFLRTLADLFYMLHVLFKFRVAFVAPSSRVFGRGELVTDRREIARRYIRSGSFFVDFVAALPFPQIVMWFVVQTSESLRSSTNFVWLELIVLLQYIPRLYQIFSLSKRIVKATGVVTQTAWAGAAYNLLLYMLASHVLGSLWYLMSIERNTTCWKSACSHEIGCEIRFLDCRTLDDDSRTNWASTTAVFSQCDPTNANSTFDYGIFKDAMGKGVVSDRFTDKLFYCLWWGLQQLSSYGQNLATSTYIWETLFCILIAILGLVIFAHLIGNMEAYLQSTTLRLEEWRLKRRDTENWMTHRQLPQNLRERVTQFLQYQWLTTHGVDEGAILFSLPKDLRRDIQRHLCLDLVRRVPFFAQMDGQLLNAICERLRSSLCTKGTYIVREGDPVTEMLFIIRGKLESSTTDGGRSGFFNSITLKPGDFCGEELLAWALVPKATTLPSSTRTVRTLAEVEAFALQAEDLKFVANQFRRLHSRKLQHTFRFHSHHWRTWGACYVQAAWRRYKRRKLTQSLTLRESLSGSSLGSFFVAGDEKMNEETTEDQETSAQKSNSSQAMQNLGITILAKRFIINTRKGARKSKSVELPLPILAKPEEPDFFEEPNDD